MGPELGGGPYPSLNPLCGAGPAVQQVRPRGSLANPGQAWAPQDLGPLTHNRATLPSAHHQGLGTALQPDGVLLIQLLELQLQPGILGLSLAEPALAGGQHLGVEAALNL